MAIYHCSVKIGGRSGGKSAVASAAYRSGQKLEDEEQGMTFDYTKKGGVIGSEILLCENAPKEYQDRATLWNAVQKIEKSKDAQLYREVELALPKEWTWEQRKQYTREYVYENFVSKGMCADICYHEKDGNPHAHIMLTTRQIKENGQWDVKERKAYMTDEDGNKVPKIDKKKLKAWEKENGRKFDYKTESDEELKKVQKLGAKNRREWERVTIKVNDWNEQYKVEEWRKAWADKCNEHLNEEQQVDHRSYERQGKNQIPTIHEGTTARKIEKEGGISDRMQINREIRQTNEQLSQIGEEIKGAEQELSQEVTEKAREIYGRFNGIVLEEVKRNGEGLASDRGITGEAAEIHGAELRASAGERQAERAEAERNGNIDVGDIAEKVAGIGDGQRELKEDIRGLQKDIREFKAEQSAPVGRKPRAEELYRGQTGKIDQEQYRINQEQQQQKDSIGEAASRFGQLRARLTELRSRVVQLREKIQNRVEEAFRKAQEAEKRSEGTNIPPKTEKAVTGQNMDAMARFRQMQEQTDRERAEKKREESQALQPGKTYRVYKDEENGVYINAKVQKAGVYGHNTVYFSLTVNGQTQELDTQVVTNDKSLKDAISYSKPTQDKISEYRETDAQRKLKEAQKHNEEHKGEPKPEAERSSVLDKLHKYQAEIEKQKPKQEAQEQKQTIHRPIRRGR